jgi:sulfite reductase beta subunit-like hemoprotein
MLHTAWHFQQLPVSAQRTTIQLCVVKHPFAFAPAPPAEHSTACTCLPACCLAFCQLSWLLVLQLAAAATTLQQLQNEHAELTRVLIDAKVEIAEKKGEVTHCIA